MVLVSSPAKTALSGLLHQSTCWFRLCKQVERYRCARNWCARTTISLQAPFAPSRALKGDDSAPHSPHGTLAPVPVHRRQNGSAQSEVLVYRGGHHRSNLRRPPETPMPERCERARSRVTHASVPEYLKQSTRIPAPAAPEPRASHPTPHPRDPKSTRLNSSH